MTIALRPCRLPGELQIDAHEFYQSGKVSRIVGRWQEVFHSTGCSLQPRGFKTAPKRLIDVALRIAG